MKTMKQFILTMSLILFTIAGYSQATDVRTVRIANATTTFDQNLPISTRVYNIATGEWFTTNKGVLGTLTLTTGSADFDKDKQGTVTSVTGGTGITSTGGATPSLSLDNTAATPGAYTNADITVDAQGRITAVANGSAGGTTLPVDDGTAIVKGSVDATKLVRIEADGLTTLTTRVITMPDVNVDLGDIATNNAKVSDINHNVTTNLSEGTTTNTTVNINSSDGTNATLAAASTTRAGLMTKTQFDKLGAIASGAEVNLNRTTEKFEENDGVATAHVLAQTAVTAQKAIVSLNGAVLDPANYTLTTTTITIAGLSVSQYDQVVITYSY